MNKAYKFRLYPNAEQMNLLTRTFGCVRFIYNKMLGDKIDYYHETGKKLSNTPAQYKEEFPWLKEVDSLALANASSIYKQHIVISFDLQSQGFLSSKANIDIRTVIRPIIKEAVFV